jgi:hypothetical protein
LILRRAIILANYTSQKIGVWPLTYLSFLLFYNQTENTLVEHNSIFWILYVSLALSPFVTTTITRKKYAEAYLFS